MADQFEKVSRVPTKTVNGVTIPDVSFEQGTAIALEYVLSDECRAALGHDTALHALLTGSVIIACTVAAAPDRIKSALLGVAEGAMGTAVQRAIDAATQKKEGQAE